MVLFYEVRREALNREPKLGRILTPTAMAAQTVTVGSLAGGGQTAQKYVNKYLLRATSATVADRIRRVTNFVASTGVLTHAGTAYSDTTVGTELVELHVNEPFTLDTAIMIAAENLKYRDRYAFAGTHDQEYPLHALSWIKQPADVLDVYTRGGFELGRNRKMEKWTDYNTSTGALTLEDWTFAGSGGTLARSTTQNQLGRYAAAMTRSGTTVTLSQTIGLLSTGVNDDNLQNESITIACRVWSDTASQVRMRVTDGVDTSNTSYHTGNSTFQELTTTHTVNAAATTLTISIQHEVDGTAYVDQAYAIRSTLGNDNRRDDYSNESRLMKGVDYWFDQPSQTLHLNTSTWGQQVVIYSKRGYPRPVASRVSDGSFDADTTDAPTINLAVEALAAFYEGKEGKKGPNAMRWREGADGLAANMFSPEKGLSRGFGTKQLETRRWPRAQRVG